MILILVIVGIVAVVFASAANKTKADANNVTIINEKTLAYADYLKRTSKKAEIQSMTTNELREFVSLNIRLYNKEKSDVENGGSVLIGIVVVGALVWASAVEEVFPIVLGLLAAFAAFRYKDMSAVKVDAKFKKEGLVPSRLKIEKTS